MPTVSAVIVSYDEPPEGLRAAVDTLLAQSRPPDEIVVVVNGDGASAAALGDDAHVRTLTPSRNLGYSSGVNYAAEHTTADYLFCLNPDARADEHCLERLLDAAGGDESVAVAGAQILLEDGATTNAGHNPLHPTGISPSGGYGRAREHGAPRDVIVVSGACCLVHRATFVALGGFVDEFFMYYDDADYGWRARIAGRRVVYCPEATAIHGYEFSRRGRKWFYVERNRLFSVLSNYERRSLVRLAPLLLLTELVLLVAAAVQGWLPQKLEAYRSLVALRRPLAAHRRHVQALRRRSDRELFPLFATRLDSPLLPRLPAKLAGALTDAYVRALR